MKGNLTTFLNADIPHIRYLIAYGNDESQIQYLETYFKKKIAEQFEFSSVEIDIKHPKTAISQVQQALKSSHTFFSNAIFLKLTKFPESALQELLTLGILNNHFIFLNMSHAKLLYKSLSQYESNPNAFFVACYPFKQNEKISFVAHYLKSNPTQIRNLIDPLSDQFDELRSQLDLLELYGLNKEHGKYEDVHKLFLKHTLRHIDDIFFSFYLTPQINAEFYELSESKEYDPHFVVRSFIKFTKKMIANLEASNDSTLPFSFGFNTNKAFVQHAKQIRAKWSRIDLLRLLSKLNTLEEKMRNTHFDSKLEFQLFWTFLKITSSQVA